MSDIIDDPDHAVASGEDARAGKPGEGPRACRPYTTTESCAEAPDELSCPGGPTAPRAWRGVSLSRPRPPITTKVQVPEAKPASGLKALAQAARRDLALAVMAPLLAGLLLLPQAFGLARVIHAALAEGAPVATLVAGFGALAGLIALRIALVWTGELAGGRAGQEIARQLRVALMRHTLARQPSWVAARPSGAVAGAIVDQVTAFETFFGRYVPALVQAAVLPVVFAAVTPLVDPIVGILFLVTAPLIILFMALVGFGAEAASRRHQQAFLQLSGLFADRLRGLLTLKLLGRAEAEAERLRLAGEELRHRTLGVLRIAFLSSAVLEFFAALGVAGVALYVGLSYLGFLGTWARPLTLETGLFCLLLAPEVYLPLRQFAAAYHDRAAAKAALTSLTDQFERLPALVADAPQQDAAPVPPHGRALSVSVVGLTLRTPDGSRTVLHDASLAVGAGAHVALLGASGAGKSTLIEALAGLRDYRGRIDLGEVSMATLGERERRGRIALLGQRPHIFHGTIEDNIRLGCPSASRAAVVAAAERAQVMHFAARLPDALATAVGEGGLGLSGGEAHRVALARLFLREPDLMLLDEPTAHLDPDTEQRVLDGLLDFAAGRTLIVATHSLAVARRMDRVYRIEGQALLPTPCRRILPMVEARRGSA